MAKEGIDEVGHSPPGGSLQAQGGLDEGVKRNPQRTPKENLKRIFSASERHEVRLGYNMGAVLVRDEVRGGIDREVRETFDSLPVLLDEEAGLMGRIIKAALSQGGWIREEDMARMDFAVSIGGKTYVIPRKIICEFTDQQLDNFFALIKKAQESEDPEEKVRLLDQIGTASKRPLTE
jgi:hypothetical protein